MGGAAPSPAQWALARMLDAAFDDPDVANRCIELALKNAGRLTIPETVDELLRFGREHLVPVLSDELGPRIVSMLFEDLANELGKLRRSDMRLAVTPRQFRQPSTIPRLTVPPITVSEVPSSSRRNPTIQSPEPRESLPATRPLIAIVESDRWSRAPIARVLVQSGCDVLPLDGSRAALDHLHRAPSDRIDVVVTEIASSDDALLLRELRARFPAVRVVAWSQLPSEQASRTLSTAGVSSFHVVPRTAPASHVADAVRRLV